MKVVVATFNQEKALVGAFSVITNLWMDPRCKLYAQLLSSGSIVTVRSDDTDSS